ncbi:2-amino-4-hydroxy-6-hydroxymethyldihydropteridine diphosphokinase [Desulfitobacterium sp. LBE]|uniref:2-amino-4-hydroxy-6-hydroxymethyldihydropteridine diphosphokinase n=5 Tax=root TaxID=1 RepID=Q251P4_DESHY|nr:MULTISPECIES: 2-amino-4-hydroxy-6-hydroxymethyldihydropteridine diphosphokinase [Desulfitobacterium]ACL18221.1 2-amino-4-hydroxy-6-hydroxymethyldihydropteridine pyrophosphokinase [Desulfitobacterium hafniense DCB-2]EHL08239.1 2-amino-4-hydroxy-6-hydroxymethyldihydropteridine diphosphokinase [Desulfitobacterium hafniense DP7]KTE93372.1 2-amino-4-hydroxy-6-hydroxymethyldihydropteridine pyrophosphokinase [Desulfitobacterium hafniense]MEA5022604.1 2-amino-4-hydroxy-6-hydroxymethyldihydropteridin
MKAYLSIGSNLGDRGHYLQQSCQRLAEHPDVKIIKKSGTYETKPWGNVDQPDFWNQVLEIETSLAPLDLLNLCQEVEKSLGRERLIRWGPRTIDIDLLNYDNKVWEDERLILPHPRMEEREFVLAPLREIAPHYILPSGKKVTEVCGDGEVWRLESK